MEPTTRARVLGVPWVRAVRLLDLGRWWRDGSRATPAAGGAAQRLAHLCSDHRQRLPGSTGPPQSGPRESRQVGRLGFVVHNVRQVSNSSPLAYASAAIRVSIRGHFDRQTDEAEEPTELFDRVQHRYRAPQGRLVAFERLMRSVLRGCPYVVSPQGIRMRRLRVAAAHEPVAWPRLVAV